MLPFFILQQTLEAPIDNDQYNNVRKEVGTGAKDEGAEAIAGIIVLAIFLVCICGACFLVCKFISKIK